MTEKLDSLVKGLTDDKKLIKNIRDYARKTIATEKRTNGMLYVEPRDFYKFIEETYPDLIPKIPENYKTIHGMDCFVELGLYVNACGLSYDELFNRFIELEKDNEKLKQELEEANKKLGSYKKLGRKTEKKPAE